MTVSSRTPEGMPHQCPICGNLSLLEHSEAGDTVCPNCGHLLWRIQGSFAARMGIDPSKIRLDTRLDDLGASSLDIVELIMEVEEALGIALPDAEVEQTRTVADLIRLINRLRDE